MTLSQTAKGLGYAGLIPFLVFAIASWIDLPGVADPHFALSSYAAVILSFMGAIHWGIAMHRGEAGASRQLSLSVLPALLGWMALLIPPVVGYAVLIGSFVSLCAADSGARRHGLVPDWYVPMRVILTTVVVLSLIAAALALVAR